MQRTVRQWVREELLNISALQEWDPTDTPEHPPTGHRGPQSYCATEVSIHACGSADVASRIAALPRCSPCSSGTLSPSQMFTAKEQGWSSKSQTRIQSKEA